jgi:hypothetical protein
MWWRPVTHGRGSEGGNWRMEWVASTLHTTSEHGVSSITTAYVHISAASSQLNWRPRRFKWTRPFRRKTKSGFYACAVTFQLASGSLIQSKGVGKDHKTNVFSKCAFVWLQHIWERRLRIRVTFIETKDVLKFRDFGLFAFYLSPFPCQQKILCEQCILFCVNPLTPNDVYICRTAPLTSWRCILYI